MLLRCRKRRSDASLALALAAKIDSQGTHQGAPPFPVVHQEGLHERGKGARSAERPNSSRKRDRQVFCRKIPANQPLERRT